MNSVKQIISNLEEVASHPGKAVKASMESTGKKAVGCFPYYAPEEIIYAAGMLPVGMWGGQSEIKYADKYMQSFCCSIMRENIEQGICGAYNLLSAIIIPTFCDTLKCICENWKVAVPQIKLIPMVYPQNRKITAGLEYLVDELNRVKKEVEDLTRRKITDEDLENSIAIYQEYRAAMRQFTDVVMDYPQTINAITRHLIIKASYFIDKVQYTEMIKELIKGLKEQPIERFDGKRVILTGIMAEPEALLDVFVQNNIVVAGDDLAQESRQFRTCTASGRNPIESLAYRLSMQDCSLLYDDAKKHGQLLKGLVKKYQADGVIVLMMKFCDPEEFDYPIYKKELEAAKIPMLYLEIEQKIDSVEQARTRIQSFTEMLSIS